MSRLTAAALAAALALCTLSLSAAQDQAVHSSKEDGIALPTVVKQVRPDYTAEALRQRLEGTVVLSSVVSTDGSVSEVRVVQSLDDQYGLDQAAIDAMKQWQFKAGTKDGQAVAVRIECEIRFALK